LGVHVIIQARHGRQPGLGDLHGIHVDVDARRAGVLDHHRMARIIGVRQAGVGLLPDGGRTVGIDGQQLHPVHKDLEAAPIAPHAIVKREERRSLEREGCCFPVCAGPVIGIVVRTCGCQRFPARRVGPHGVNIIVHPDFCGRVELIRTDIADRITVLIAILGPH
jgi:hypothetical protein